MVSEHWGAGAFMDTVFRVGPSEKRMVEQRLSEGKQQGHLMQEHSRQLELNIILERRGTTSEDTS